MISCSKSASACLSSCYISTYIIVQLYSVCSTLYSGSPPAALYSRGQSAVCPVSGDITHTQS